MKNYTHSSVGNNFVNQVFKYLLIGQDRETKIETKKYGTHTARCTHNTKRTKLNTAFHIIRFEFYSKNRLDENVVHIGGRNRNMVFIMFRILFQFETIAQQTAIHDKRGGGTKPHSRNHAIYSINFGFMRHCTQYWFEIKFLFIWITPNYATINRCIVFTISMQQLSHTRAHKRETDYVFHHTISINGDHRQLTNLSIPVTRFWHEGRIIIIIDCNFDRRGHSAKSPNHTMCTRHKRHHTHKTN